MEVKIGAPGLSNRRPFFSIHPQLPRFSTPLAPFIPNHASFAGSCISLAFAPMLIHDLTLFHEADQVELPKMGYVAENV